MAELKDWLSIDKVSGEGNDVITLTASLLEEVGERNASIKISTATKSVYLNLKQRKLDAPVNPDDILDNELWVKSADGSQVTPYSSSFSYKVSKTRLTSDGWTLYTLVEPLTEIDGMAFYQRDVQEVVMPKTVTTIGRYAFGSCKLESLDIPDSVTTIGEFAFEGNPIATLKIGSGISEIISSTFNGCNDITSIVVSENNETYDSRNNSNCIIETATNKLILGCSGTVIPNTVTVIGDRAFTENTTNITIPNSVITIEEYAFGSTNLKSIVIPDSVTSIGEGAFTLCYGLTSVTLGNGLTSIGKGAFSFCKLTSINIPDSVTTISNEAFQYCENLESVYIGSGLSNFEGTAFGSTYNLSSIVVSPNNPKYHSIDNCVIETETNELVLGCKNSVIPNTVKEINYGAFYGCQMTSIDIPDSVTRINSSSFYGCNKLTSLVIPDSVTYIGLQAFMGCSGLTTVTLGSKVSTIEYNGFNGCKNLERIICKGKAAYINSTTFKYVKTGGVLEYPKSYSYSSWLSTSSYYLGYYNWTGSPY